MRLDDGYQTLITFSANPTVKFWEKTVTPPGVDGGGPTDTTTMRNTTWRTQAPKFLKTLTEGSITVAYDPEALIEAKDMINVNQQITISFPDGSSLTFWGWMNSIEPGEHTEGEQPTADVSLQPSNMDSTGAEVGPVYNPPA
jgi:hypothetical protein